MIYLIDSQNVRCCCYFYVTISITAANDGTLIFHITSLSSIHFSLFTLYAILYCPYLSKYSLSLSYPQLTQYILPSISFHSHLFFMSFIFPRYILQCFRSLLIIYCFYIHCIYFFLLLFFFLTISSWVVWDWSWLWCFGWLSMWTIL